jgi:hypothetical protein
MPSFEKEEKDGHGLEELALVVSSFKQEGIAVGDWKIEVRLRRSTPEERAKATAAVLYAASKKKK